MRTITLIAGLLLIAIAGYYFIKLSLLLLQDYEFTNYGYGILTGNVLLLIGGVALLIWGLKRTKKRKG